MQPKEFTTWTPLIILSYWTSLKVKIPRLVFKITLFMRSIKINKLKIRLHFFPSQGNKSYVLTFTQDPIRKGQLAMILNSSKTSRKSNWFWKKSKTIFIIKNDSTMLMNGNSFLQKEPVHRKLFLIQTIYKNTMKM